MVRGMTIFGGGGGEGGEFFGIKLFPGGETN